MISNSWRASSTRTTSRFWVVTVTSPSNVQIHAQGAIQNLGLQSTQQSQVDVAVFQDGLLIAPTYRRVLAVNGPNLVAVIQNFSTHTIVANLAPGTYTFSLAGLKVPGSTNAQLGGDASNVLRCTMDIVVSPL